MSTRSWIAFTGVMIAGLVPGCFGDDGGSHCPGHFDDLFLQIQPKDSEFDRARKVWTEEGPAILGRYVCVDDLRVSEVAFRVQIPTTGSFVYHIDASDELPGSIPTPMHVQAIDAQGRYYDAGTDHPATDVSVGLAMGTWHETWRKQEGPNRTFPYLSADFEITFEDSDPDADIDVFPRGSLYLDVWERDRPTHFIRQQIIVEDDTNLVWGEKTSYSNQETTKDPVSGRTIPTAGVVR